MIDLSNSKILIVDDDKSYIDILLKFLGNSYDVRIALNGKGALYNVQTQPPDLILLDIMMPEMDGFEVCSILKKKDKTKDIPIIFLTAANDIEKKQKAFESGAVDYITKPFNILEVNARVKTHLMLKHSKELLYNENKFLETMIEERTRELITTQNVTMQSLAALAETRDNETGGHIQRTKYYVKLLAEKISEDTKHCNELDFNALRLIYQSAPLHDIGKVGIPDSILLKPGKLETEEFESMKKHTVIGRNAILKSMETLGTNGFLRFASEIAYTHHEKWNGAGYPNGLKEDNIPLPGRVMAVADVYDALISKRVYKEPFTHSKSVEIIESESGNSFDPCIVESFIELREDFRETALRYCDYPEEKIALSR